MRGKIKRETALMRQIKQLLEFRGWFVIRFHQSLGSFRGLSDLAAVKNGRVVWIEVKAPGGRQSPYQLAFEDNIRDHGGEYLLARRIEDLEGL